MQDTLDYATLGDNHFFDGIDLKLSSRCPCRLTHLGEGQSSEEDEEGAPSPHHRREGAVLVDGLSIPYHTIPYHTIP